MSFAPKSSLLVAAAAASLFAGGLSFAPVSAEAADAVKCVGANACKGQSACATASSSCKGHNACKGQGFTTTSTKEECTKAGGKPA